MKKFKRFFRAYKDRILSGITLVLLVAVIGLVIVYLVSDSMNPSVIFFAAALLMADLAVNYSLQKKKSKGVYVFYALATVACIAIGCVLCLMPSA